MSGSVPTRPLVRRALLAMLAVVVLSPLALLGGVWGLLVVPCLVAAVVALRSALQLRRIARSVTTLDGDEPA